MPGEQELLQLTAANGFIAPGTIAAVLGLEERMLIQLVDRLGGEVHFPRLVEQLQEPETRTLKAAFDEDGDYVLSLDPPPPPADVPPDPEEEIPW